MAILLPLSFAFFTGIFIANHAVFKGYHEKVAYTLDHVAYHQTKLEELKIATLEMLEVSKHIILEKEIFSSIHKNKDYMKVQCLEFEEAYIESKTLLGIINEVNYDEQDAALLEKINKEIDAYKAAVQTYSSEHGVTDKEILNKYFNEIKAMEELIEGLLDKDIEVYTRSFKNAEEELEVLYNRIYAYLGLFFFMCAIMFCLSLVLSFRAIEGHIAFKKED